MDYIGKGTTSHNYNDEKKENQKTRAWYVGCKEDFAQLEREIVNDKRRYSKIVSWKRDLLMKIVKGKVMTTPIVLQKETNTFHGRK